jgi:uncharacterized protein (TIGR02246 family)
MGAPELRTNYDIKASEVRNVLDTMIRAQEAGNWELFASCFAPSSKALHIGTDLDEYWVGWNAFQQFMKNAITERRGCQIHEKSTHINFSQDGNVAWYTQLTDTCIETKGDMIRIEGFRHTGVMERFNNRWLVVHTHFSAPIIETSNRLYSNNQFQYAF